ncbi:MAG: GNAT family N-acetyltransferase [Clostridiales bacterium]
MNLMKIKELSWAEVCEIYNEHYVIDFPKDERKKIDHIERLLKEDNYVCYGLFENNVMRAYAFLCKNKDSKNMILDYLSVISNYRGSGYGSAFLKLLKGVCGNFQGLILEVESVDHAIDEEDKKIRERRMAFYFDNGLKPTKISTSVKGVVFSIIYYPFDEKWDNESLFADLNQLYPTLVPEKHIDFLKLN